MADLKAAVVEMLRQGMSEQEVKSSLEELGVADADGLYAEAVAGMGNAKKQGANAQTPSAASFPQQPQRQAQPAPITRPKTTGIQPPSAQPPSSSEPAVERELQEIPEGGQEVSAKIDDAIALLRAIQEINRKILETNRDILLRLKQ